MIAATAVETARAVREGRVSADMVLDQALARIGRRNPALNCFTRLLHARARKDAARVDQIVAAGGDPGPLAGVPFGVKDLFDIAGEPTTAGAAARRDAPPATSDAVAVGRMCGAGAVLVGTLNMDEFAYGFVTENAWFGTTRNPYDTTRLAGGSSGGSAAAVAAGMVPIALGSDTNGSIRVPASLCGIYGLRATHGRIDARGSFPFVDSLDVVGPLAASLADLENAYRVMSNDRGGAASVSRIAILDGWFAQDGDSDAAAAVAAIARIFDAPRVTLPAAGGARSAAFVLTAAEGGARHRNALRRDPLAFDPATRDRLIAGSRVSHDDLAAAKAFGDRWRALVAPFLDRHDVLVAPATPTVAPPIGESFMTLGGQPVSARANLGLLTQPLGCADACVMSVPLLRPSGLPLGLQLVARAGGEARLFAFAHMLEEAGFVGFSAPAFLPC